MSITNAQSGTSLAARKLPQWYKNAKFGIFIHWGPPSVPAWAPPSELNTQDIIRLRGLKYYFKSNPYADWYFNTMRIPGSETEKYHKSVWKGAPYEEFGELFNRHSARDDHRYFEEWAALFARAGARYVVPVTKHHDGFTLWPTNVPGRKKNWGATEDLIGKLRRELDAKGIKMGVYYSGYYDWSWNDRGIRNGFTAAVNAYQSAESVAYMDSHVRELIERYEPAVFWNDIGYLTHPDTGGAQLSDVLSFYYSKVPDGVIDDRWFEIPAFGKESFGVLEAVTKYFAQPGSEIAADVIDELLSLLFKAHDHPGGLKFPPSRFLDFRTYEYDLPAEICEQKWELVRGIGLSFCYNRAETDAHKLTSEELRWLFVEVVSKNGNLLLNIGPRSDGTLQPYEAALLEDFGTWMRTFGEALYDSDPWSALPSNAYTLLDSEGDLRFRFTVVSDSLNVFVRTASATDTILIPGICPDDAAIFTLRVAPATRIQLQWAKDAGGVKVELPAVARRGGIHCTGITPLPRWIGQHR